MPRRIFATVAMLLICSQAVFAQQQTPQNQQGEVLQTEVLTPSETTAVPIPAMRNVFFNTLWGSLVGGVLQMSYHIVDDSLPASERFGIPTVAGKFFQGATLGGVVGVTVGLLLSLNNVTYYDDDIFNKTNFGSGLSNGIPPNSGETGGGFRNKLNGLRPAPGDGIVYHYPIFKLDF